MLSDLYQSIFPDEIRDSLFELCSKYCIDPESSIECENYFSKIINEIHYESIEELMCALDKIIKKDFLVMNEYPEWVQDSDWQFNNGKPMIFIGQMEKDYGVLGIYETFVFYTFYDKRDGTVETIIQSY